MSLQNGNDEETDNSTDEEKGFLQREETDNSNNNESMRRQDMNIFVPNRETNNNCFEYCNKNHKRCDECNSTLVKPPPLLENSNINLFKCCRKQKDEKSDDIKDTKPTRCEQCKLFVEKLEITTEDELKFTVDHINFLIISIIFSPITWLWIPLFGEGRNYILPTLIITTIMFIIGLFIINNGYTTISRINTSPFGLANGGFLFRILIYQFVLNLCILIEMIRMYFVSQTNIVYQCYYENFENETKPPSQCMIYLDILGNSFVVFFSSIYINVACIRTIKPSKLKIYRSTCNNEKLKEELVEIKKTTKEIGQAIKKFEKQMDRDDVNEHLDELRKEKKGIEDDLKSLCDKYQITDINITEVGNVSLSSTSSKQLKEALVAIKSQIITQRYEDNGYDEEMKDILEKYKKREQQATDDRKKSTQSAVDDLEENFHHIRTILTRDVNSAGFGIPDWCRVYGRDISKRYIHFFEELAVFITVWVLGGLFCMHLGFFLFICVEI